MYMGGARKRDDEMIEFCPVAMCKSGDVEA